jgi:cytochrome c-type biogenesis protein CcmH
MGYLWLGLAALLALGLMWAMKIRGSLLTLAAAAVAFGCAGYALQGRPGLPGQPRVAEGRAPPVPLTRARQALMGRFDSADAWLNLSEGIASRGNTADAVGIMRSAVREHPHNYKLWVGLGNALTDHARMLTPAGRFAFERAAELAPGHPAPAFFLGLAEARSGNPAEAAKLWREILANAPADVSWRPLVEDGLLLIEGGTAPAAPPAPEVQTGT